MTDDGRPHERPRSANVRGIDHTGLTVPDLEAAVRFFVEALECVELYRIGPFRADDDWMTRRLDVDRGAVIPQIAVLGCGSGSRLELFRYEAPDQDPRRARNSDIAGHHVAFYVDDIEAAMARLAAHGAELLEGPTVMASGPSAGEAWVYVRAPWGLQLELVTRDVGRRPERARPAADARDDPPRGEPAAV